MGHVNLLLGSRYQAFNGDFASRVSTGGYATDPAYRNKLTQIYNEI
jgi:flagellum-specific peptidoglycan hydrolase FlgJ